jgi:hypothetical protein
MKAGFLALISLSLISFGASELVKRTDAQGNVWEGENRVRLKLHNYVSPANIVNYYSPSLGQKV